MPCQPPTDCSRGASYDLDPNPDISGIGVGLLGNMNGDSITNCSKVVVGFVASGWSTLLLLVLRYIVAPSEALAKLHIPREDLLDSYLRRGARRLLRRWAPSPQWGPALENVGIHEKTIIVLWY